MRHECGPGLLASGCEDVSRTSGRFSGTMVPGVPYAGREAAGPVTEPVRSDDRSGESVADRSPTPSGHTGSRFVVCGGRPENVTWQTAYHFRANGAVATTRRFTPCAHLTKLSASGTGVIADLRSPAMTQRVVRAG